MRSLSSHDIFLLPDHHFPLITIAVSTTSLAAPEETLFTPSSVDSVRALLGFRPPCAQQGGPSGDLLCQQQSLSRMRVYRTGLTRKEKVQRCMGHSSGRRVVLVRYFVLQSRRSLPSGGMAHAPKLRVYHGGYDCTGLYDRL